jgi:outer membrane murein-binding lipoprotein Lpp
MYLNCKYCNVDIDTDIDESSIEGKLIQCSSCDKEWIYMTKSECILDKLEELDLSWKKKENSLNEQLSNYNSKIEELEKDLKVKNKELSEQKTIEDRIILFEKRITNTEKINAEQAELESKIEKMKDELKETSDKILNKNKDFENKANYLEMKIKSSNIISNKNTTLNEETVNINKFKQKENTEETNTKKVSFWRR